MNKTDLLNTKMRTRIKKLYMKLEIIPSPSDFRCPYLNECQKGVARHGTRLTKGNWAYVGYRYESANLSGNLARILFVSMDRGGHGGTDEETFSQAQAAFREAAKKRSVPDTKDTNPHMGETDVIMLELTGEMNPKTRSLQFALTNAVKCAEITGSSRSHPSAAMKRNCRNHFAAEIACLTPHLVITQGSHPETSIHQVFPNLQRIERFDGPTRHAEL